VNGLQASSHTLEPSRRAAALHYRRVTPVKGLDLRWKRTSRRLAAGVLV
jgi:hypothetical protein